jgi:hypothetical protein
MRNGQLELLDALNRNFLIAAEVRRVLKDGQFTLKGSFFPVDYATAEEWANDFGFDELDGADIAPPADWITQQEDRGIFVPGTYPARFDEPQVWVAGSRERYFVTLAVTRTEFLIVRHIASSARALGFGCLIGEGTDTATAQMEH